MTGQNHALAGDEGSQRPQMVRVWDGPTRLFHWLLVASVAVAMLTGYLAPEWWMGTHLIAGYAIVLLLVFRLVWGIFGPEYARLINLARSTRYLGAYVRGLALLRPPHYVGHNPVGALMIFAFFGVFLGLVATGLMVQAGEEKQGPLAGIVGYAVGHAAKEVHEILAFAALAMIAIHISGVLVESWLQNVNLTRGMIDGRMPLPPGFSMPRPRAARPLAAGVVMLLIASLSSASLYGLSRMPPLGIPIMPENATYRSECGACHWSFHPSLLPKMSWEQLLAKLDEHFGEDASLSADKKDEIARYLTAYSAESWDTEAANRFRLVSASDPMQITKTPYWVAKHRQIDPKIFQSAGVKSSSNCTACHKDADTGRFDDQKIEVPKVSRP
jgi:cytochrome b